MYTVEINRIRQYYFGSLSEATDFAVYWRGKLYDAQGNLIGQFSSLPF